MDHNNDKKPLKNKEAPGYGYDKSLDDLKVIGKNRSANERQFEGNDKEKK